MIRIAITGNIASGKSVVEQFFKNYNYPVIDTDFIVHELFKNSQDLNIQLRESFSGYDIYVDDLIDRNY